MEGWHRTMNLLLLGKGDNELLDTTSWHKWNKIKIKAYVGYLDK